jgi:hypothetical protein
MTQDEKGAIKIAIVLILLLCWFRRKDKMLQKAPAVLEQNEDKYPIIWFYNKNGGTTIARPISPQFNIAQTTGDINNLKFETCYIPRKYGSNASYQYESPINVLGQISNFINRTYAGWTLNDIGITVPGFNSPSIRYPIPWGQRAITSIDYSKREVVVNGNIFNGNQNTPINYDLSDVWFAFNYSSYSISGGFIYMKVWENGKLINEIRPTDHLTFKDVVTGEEYTTPAATLTLMQYDEPPLPL